MEDIIKKSGVREYIQTNGPTPRIGEDVYAALDERVKELLDRAQDRADANNRTTLQARDL